MSLEKLRRQIDDIDRQLISLLNRRAELAVQIGAIKEMSGKDVLDQTREKFIIERIKALNAGPLDDSAMQIIFQTIIQQCREIQK